MKDASVMSIVVAVLLPPHCLFFGAVDCGLRMYLTPEKQTN